MFLLCLLAISTRVLRQSDVFKVLHDIEQWLAVHRGFEHPVHLLAVRPAAIRPHRRSPSGLSAHPNASLVEGLQRAGAGARSACVGTKERPIALQLANTLARIDELRPWGSVAPNTNARKSAPVQLLLRPRHHIPADNCLRARTGTHGSVEAGSKEPLLAHRHNVAARGQLEGTVGRLAFELLTELPRSTGTSPWHRRY